MSSLKLLFHLKGKGEEEKKGEKGITKEGIVGFLVSPPRQIKIRAFRAICLLKKLSGMTVYNVGGVEIGRHGVIDNFTMFTGIQLMEKTQFYMQAGQDMKEPYPP